MKTAWRMYLGLAFWAAAIGLVWQMTSCEESDRAQAAHWTAQLVDYSTGARRELHLQLPMARDLAIGDPIFIETPDGSLKQVGQISSLGSYTQAVALRQARVDEAVAQMYPSAPALGANAELTYISTPDSLAWVLQTLLPQAKRAEIAAELSTAFGAHRGEILAALRPVAEQSVRDTLGVIEQDLSIALARHRAELEAIGARYHKDIVEAEVVPLVKEEVWPIVRQHGEPVVTEVGRELWQRVSLWRFGWRAMYDRSLLPQKQLVEKEFRRFADEEAVPLLQGHAEDIQAAIEHSLKDTARNPRVRAALRRNLAKIMEDPELQAVLGTIFREVIVDNPRLRESLERNFSSPQAQAAFQLAGERLEPTVRRIGDLVFGTPDEGISPEFAAVLRNQILHKDRRWLLLADRGSAETTATSQQPRVVQVRFPARDVSPRAIGGRLNRDTAG